MSTFEKLLHNAAPTRLGLESKNRLMNTIIIFILIIHTFVSEILILNCHIIAIIQ